ncbi:unnamed protein product [Cylindrotheca closterium]|uniref:Rhodanese domain-containing protein n=1 Tax=Cylindrotheca closterium TaxID=2856 RepID=A0AAD2G3I6_9STRA|nr:unnamed protein product [Cylindrotheca closterium]
MMLAVLSFLLLLAFVAAQPSNIDGVTILDPEDFKSGIDSGEYDAIIDVRSQSEWDAGHIEGATLALNLAAYPSDEVETASPTDFAGCETCTIVIYCRSGARASVALQNMMAAGFNGTLYNGQGTNQWEDAGYSLINGDSVVPPCELNEIGQCTATAPSTAPTPEEVKVTVIEPETFKNGIDNGEFDAVIDVRTQDEWDEGHIEGATLALNLALFGTGGTASPADFTGCETCTIVVYCRSGGRALAALDHLIAAGFNGTLYNGQGTSQWTNAGYPLVTTDSMLPPCTNTEIGTCTAAMSMAPTDMPTGITPDDSTMAPTTMTTGDTPEDSASTAIHSWPMPLLVGLLSVFVV